MSREYQTVSIYLKHNLKNDLELRGDNRSQIINRDLARLYNLYRWSLKGINLTVDECALIVDALNGTAYDGIIAPSTWLLASIEDAVQLGRLDTKWKVDGRALLDKLCGLSDAQALAVIDAAERFWVQNPLGDIKENIKAFFGGGHDA